MSQMRGEIRKTMDGTHLRENEVEPEELKKSAKTGYSGTRETVAIYAWGAAAAFSLFVGIGAALLPESFTGNTPSGSGRPGSNDDIVASISTRPMSANPAESLVASRFDSDNAEYSGALETVQPKLPAKLEVNQAAERLNPYPRETKRAATSAPTSDARNQEEKIQARASIEVPETLGSRDIKKNTSQSQPSPAGSGRLDIGALKPAPEAESDIDLPLLEMHQTDAPPPPTRRSRLVLAKPEITVRRPLKKRAQRSVKKDLDLGVDIGGARTVADLMERYKVLAARAPDLFKNVKPLVQLVEINDEYEARLVAGPFLSASRTYHFCRELRVRFTMACSRTKYAGREMPKLKY